MFKACYNVLLAFLMLAIITLPTRSADDHCAFPSRLSSDRAAIERIYHEHRAGVKKPFEETISLALLEQLVKAEALKEAVLKRVYGVEITHIMVEAEAERITTTTRTPELLAEIKKVLGNDSERFAWSVARPIVVERLLREHFDNDDKLHSPQRHAMKKLRKELLAAKKEGKSTTALFAQLNESAITNASNVTESEWLLAPRPREETTAEKPNQPNSPSTTKSQAGAYSVEATAQVAQILASPEKAAKDQNDKQRIYFESLPPELQKVLRTQLRLPGDVSAVIEMPSGFVLYLTKEKTHDILAIAVVSFRKRSYEQWLAEQPEYSP